MEPEPTNPDHSEEEEDEELSSEEPELLDPAEMAEEKKTLGNQLYLQKKYREAVTLYSQAIELNPTECKYRGNRAAAYMAYGRYKEALEDCEVARTIEPGFVKVYLRGARCQMHQSDFKGARETLELIRARPEGKRDATVASDIELVGTVETKLKELKLLVSQEKWAEALTALEFVKTHIGDSIQVQTLSAEILLGNGHFARAGPICSALYRANPRDSDIITLRATTAYYTGQADAALKLLRGVLQSDPDNRKCMKIYKMIKKLEATKAKGNEAFKSGRNQEAYDAYTEALACDPLNKEFNATLYGNRAAAAMKMKDWGKALTDCNRSLQLKPDYLKSLLRRGNCKLELERYADAVRDFEQAKELEPENRDVRKQLQNAQLELKKSKRKNYYKILGVEKSADERTIKKSYRKLALIWHPDKNSETPEAQQKAEIKFKDITEAYACLSDPTKKRRYDQGADIDELNGGGGCGGGGGMDPNDVFNMFFAQQQGA